MTDIAAARPGTRARRGLTVVVAAALAGGLLLPATAAARADDLALRPPTATTLTLEGRGFGHGRGMSQWGAYGAAQAGLSWREILAFYYPGTSRHTLGDSTIRVWISADNDGDTTVAAQAGLSATVGNTTRLLPTTGITGWRAVATNGAVVLQYRGGSGAWRTWSLPPAPSVLFSTPSGTVRVVHTDGAQQELRGKVHSILDGGRLRTVLVSGMESYLRSVVPHEMPASWHTSALAAQSVAARTYAASYRDRQRARGAVWDICDTVTCQVFKGVARYSASGARTALESARADAAIGATAGTILRTGASASSAFVHAEFSASNGGYTVAGGPFYQVAKPDPYDGRITNTVHTWKVTVPIRTIEQKYGVGTLQAVRVLSRDGRGPLGGRVQKVRFEGTTRSIEATGADVRAKLGLRSDWFAVAGSVTVPPGSPTPLPPSPLPTAPAPTLPTSPPVSPTPPVQPPASAGPARDWSGDGRADVLTTDAAGRLLLRSSDGRGILGGPRVVGSGWRGFDEIIAAGQWDGVGGQDLIARHAATGRLYLFPGNGRGGWGRSRIIGTGWGPYSSLTEVGDWDGDGRADLMGLRTATRDLVLIRGRAGGGLVNPVTIARLGGARWVRGVGDVTGDGRPDLVSATSRGVLVIHAGNGRGRIARQITLGGGWAAFAEVWGPRDFAGTGRNDILALNRAGRILRYPGTGAGGFGRAVTVGSVPGVVRVAR